MIALLGDPAVRSVQIIAVAFGAVAIALGCRQADSSHLGSASRGVNWIALAAPLLVLAQLVPLPLSWSHPIWASAAEALPGQSFGHVTVDIGRSVQALVAIVALATATGICIAVARDRRRAELILLAASVFTTLLSLTVLFTSFFSGGPAGTIPSQTAIGFVGIGLILNLAVLLLAFERYETRRKEAAHYVPVGLGGCVAILINGAALYRIADASQWTVVALGVAIMLLLLVIRRWALSRWTIGALCAAALIGTGIVMAWLFDKNAAASGLLRFVPPPPADMLATLQRLIADSRWFGSGANTFDVVARIYQSADPVGSPAPPTFAIALAVETGWVGLLVFTVSGLALFTKLFTGALERGRDWFFPAAAAACVAVCLCGSLVAAGLTQLPFATMLAIIVGVGLSQGVSQSSSR